MKHPKHENSPVAKSKNAAKTAALMGVLVAVAFVLSYVEMVLHFSVGIPGVKLGLCHIVTLFALYRIDPKAAVFTCFVRIILNAWLFGNTMILAYSAAGALLSLAVMLLLYRLPLFSPVGVSLAGGISHNVGQIICAALMMDTAGLVWYLPILLVSGCLSGVLVGLISGWILRRFEHRRIL